MRLPLLESASVILAGWPASAASATSPNAFQTFLAVTAAAGTFTVQWTVTLAGTIGAGEANNFMLMYGPPGGPDTQIAQSVNAAAAGTYPQAAVTVTIPPGSQIKIKAWSNAPTVGAVYGGSIGNNGVGTARLNPDEPAALWYPDTVHVQCSDNSNEAQCIIYAGPSPVQEAFVDATYSGSSGDVTDKIGGRVIGRTRIPYIWAVWTGGTFGAQATMIISGAKELR